METIELEDGIEMPLMGFGTYQMPPRITERCVSEALSAGYRAVDTAQCYGNEAQVGRAVAGSGLDRSEVFVTTKTWTDGYRSTLAGIERSVSVLGGYVDLLLIHEPTADIQGTWRALEEAKERGLARTIGVSNFLDDNLRKVLAIAQTTPTVDQVETHVYRQQAELQRQLAAEGIVLESWSPLACGQNGIFRDPILGAIGEAHDKSAAQVALRWLVQRGIPFNVKSTHPDHMAENLAVFDFALTDDEMAPMATLDTGRSQLGWW